MSEKNGVLKKSEPIGHKSFNALSYVEVWCESFKSGEMKKNTADETQLMGFIQPVTDGWFFFSYPQKSGF